MDEDEEDDEDDDDESVMFSAAATVLITYAIRTPACTMRISSMSMLRWKYASPRLYRPPELVMLLPDSSTYTVWQHNVDDSCTHWPEHGTNSSSGCWATSLSQLVHAATLSL